MRKESDKTTLAMVQGAETGPEPGAGADNGDAEETPIDATKAWQSYERLKSKLEAIPASSVQQFRANVPKAISNAFKVIRSFERDRERFEPLLGLAVFKAEDLEDLADRPMALWHADIKLRQALERVGDLGDVLETGRVLQRKLRKNALFLWSEDAGLQGVITGIRRGRGKLDLADDLAALADLFESRWAEVENRCGLEKADIEAGKVLSIRLIEKLNASAVSAEATAWRDQRDRAGEYLVRGIRAVRHAAAMLFDQSSGLSDSYPSLYAGRRPHRPSKAPAPAQQPTPPPVAPSSQSAS